MQIFICCKSWIPSFYYSFQHLFKIDTNFYKSVFRWSKTVTEIQTFKYKQGFASQI